MKYVDEFRDGKLIKDIAGKIRKKSDPKKEYRFMEVCGTHTMSIAKFGLKELLPANIKLISGPGCPVCVTPVSYIDKAIAYCALPDIIIATFGDMIKVPGSKASLESARGGGAGVEIVYSAMDALRFAEDNPKKRVVFLAVGFETTAPTVAATIKEAGKKKLDNFFILCGHKIMPPALKALVSDKRLALDGFILPAHVSAIIGSAPYEFIKRRSISGVITGFEPLDIMQGVLMLIKRVSRKKPGIDIQYNRVVKPSGNTIAQAAIKRVFRLTDSRWRGLGVISKSGLAVREKFSAFDAEKNIAIKTVKPAAEPKGCICTDILKGIRAPGDCALFDKACTPRRPIGPCMVSSEGACSAWYNYREF